MSVAMSRWLLELRQALQSLARTPAFTATAVLTLGVGLGSGAATYTLVRDIVLDPLGYPDAERLVVVRSEVPGLGAGAEWQASFAQYYQFRDNARTLSGIGLYGTVGMNIDTPSGADRVMAVMASADVQELIGARTVRGRSPVGGGQHARGCERSVDLARLLAASLRWRSRRRRQDTRDQPVRRRLGFAGRPL